jgi:hypothetical protein
VKRIFVRGISRSGGTLMTTVIDAHPDIAMCYEIYQHLLEPAESSERSVELLREGLRKAGRKGPSIGDSKLHRFANRVLRGGTEPRALLELIEKHCAGGRSFDTFEDRMRLMEDIALDKMRREGKTGYGMKIASVYDELHAMHPDAYFLFMLRDGRDVAASRKKVGDFKQSTDEIALAWVRQIRKFRKFAEREGVKGMMVRYEHLASDPEDELRGIIDFLELPWTDDLLSFHKKDLSIYRNPTGHLSADAVSKPISTASVHRWRKDLTPAEIETFESVAGEQLEAAGYERS